MTARLPIPICIPHNTNQPPPSVQLRFPNAVSNNPTLSQSQAMARDAEDLAQVSDSEVGERSPLLAPPGDGVTDSPATAATAFGATSRRLYASHFLSTWNSRVFEFGSVLYLAALFPGTLLPLSIYALARGVAAILFAPAVGHFVDRADRLRVVRLSIGMFQQPDLFVRTPCAGTVADDTTSSLPAISAGAPGCGHILRSLLHSWEHGDRSRH